MTNNFDYFDKIYCINLPNYVARHTAAQQQFNRVDLSDRINFTWAEPPVEPLAIHGFRHPKGQLGCTLSHLKVWIDAIAHGAKSIVVFEDDMQFVGDDTNERLGVALAELPSDWDIFYLGGKPITPLGYVTDNVSRVGHFLTTHAYALSDRALKRICDSAIDNITRYPVDVVLALFSMANIGYCVNPPLCIQSQGVSSIGGTFMNYEQDMKEHWNKYGIPTKTK